MNVSSWILTSPDAERHNQVIKMVWCSWGHLATFPKIGSRTLFKIVAGRDQNLRNSKGLRGFHVGVENWCICSMLRWWRMVDWSELHNRMDRSTTKIICWHQERCPSTRVLKVILGFPVAMGGELYGPQGLKGILEGVQNAFIGPTSWESTFIATATIFVIAAPVLLVGLSLSGVLSAFVLGLFTFRAFGGQGTAIVFLYFLLVSNLLIVSSSLILSRLDFRGFFSFNKVLWCSSQEIVYWKLKVLVSSCSFKVALF